MKKKLKSNSPISSFRDTPQEKLIKAAKKLRATTIGQAQGRCLTMSLEFCLLARKYNIPVELVMWSIKNDPVFCDHWAVRINQTQVIDLTRIQVDSKLSSEVLFDITDYPSNYQIPRFYETALLLEEYIFFKNANSEKLPPTLIKNIRNLMLKQDLASVNHFKNFSGMTTALLSYAKFRLFLYLSQLEERLHQRRDALRSR